MDEFADDHDVPRSEIVREAVKTHLPDEDLGGPRDPELRETWQWLRVRTNERGRVPAIDAISALAQQNGIRQGVD
ncbi:hypothetical protein C487_16259 [Natrinema pallidum DSM 3751]|uniref:Uncharacterized protein n=1 Tax=Natrinema pallidum DSM 3751 TaxID=1227495 RepID=L9YMK9_9EURY|nr:hypothetical protein C487_16259 [Natrinema pallidum DSM 3751]